LRYRSSSESHSRIGMVRRFMRSLPMLS
jgi:hypothetical protein